ncbi:HlyD family efflux transporter periplasmic adaptor subunit [Heliorestis acidaminivorans]|uniref:HlyD family efflux transporter periplasmic adaptor subunit n=1 Tax=Heliorestis acidaminivorans TaxID=553427 RepID=A0A6I0EQR5_9FIRM|nr:HlyD family efflux transporter periplasmic adaptor subunit [Heliorestis acidaminivorans]KAB2952556.1 HlyD family efflux transporter periplasmic adaptor subunit [Heliorestis acidaminivorans]
MAQKGHLSQKKLFSGLFALLLLISSTFLVLSFLVPKPTEVETISADHGSVWQELWISGEVRPQKEISLYTPRPGLLEWLVQEGDPVKQDQPIARLGDFDVLSPMDGKLTEKMAHSGVWVPLGVPLGQISDMEDLIVHALVDESEVLLVEPGMPVQWSFTGYPGQVFSGEVLSLSKMARRDLDGNRGFQVTISVPDDVKVYAGMTADGKILLEEVQDLRISVDSIWEERGVAKVYVLRDGRATVVDVKLGIRDDFYAQVLEGLEVGDEVIIPSGLSITTGQSVKVKSSAPART